jgi:hypothetical protein
MSGCVQSENPEDTMAARQEGLTAEDFEGDEGVEQDAPARRCLSAEEILAAEDREHLENWVPTPEWGGPGAGVYVLTPSGEDRNRYEQAQKVRKVRRGNRVVEERSMNLDQLHERLVVDFACNEAGERIFHRDHLVKLRKKAAAPVARIGSECCRLMGWTGQDIADLVGNSDTGQS